VAGAGPAGLVAALLLAREGFEPLLIGPPSPPDPRTIAFMSPSIKLLTHIGIWTTEMQEFCAPLRELHIMDDTGNMVEAPPLRFQAEELGLAAFGWNVPLASLLPALQQEIARLGIHTINSRIARIELSEREVTVQTEAGEHASAPAAIAADGSSSVMREAAGIAIRRWSFDQDALVTQFDHSGPHNDVSTEWHRRGGVFTTVPLPGHRSSLVWLDKPAEIARLMEMPADVLASEIQLASHGTLGLISGVWPCRRFPMRGVAAERYGAKRVYLVGEASHVFPPVGAQGLNMSFRDIGHAVEQMQAHADPGGVDAIAAYNALRVHDVEPRQYAISAVNHTLLAESVLPHALRALGLRALQLMPTLRDYVMREGLSPQTRLPQMMQD
jgi:2-octaprenyl-6-methoxyphenol hydroxylase